tara:strand:- start:9095 stop:10354 length:1260 start_codon:yes stop_codon:yes gene_type:complete
MKVEVLVFAKIFMVGTSGLAKLSPLLFGAYLSTKYGGDYYSSFVLLLNYAAAASAAATMSYTPQALRAAATPNPKATVSIAAISSGLIFILSMVLSAIYWVFWETESFFPLLSMGSRMESLIIILFCSSLFFLAVSHSSMSCSHKWFLLGLSNVFVYVGSLILVLVFLFFIGPSDAVLILYSAIFFLFAFFSFIVAAINTKLFSLDALKGLSLKRALWEAIFGLRVAIFGMITLAGYYLMALVVNRQLTSEEAAVYSLSFQLFSITLFLPSVLGSLVIPILSRTPSNSIGMEKLTLFSYLGVSLTFALFFIFFSGSIMDLYGIKVSDSSKLSLSVFQVAAILAALGAYFVQRLIVGGRYLVLAFGAITWLMFVLLGLLLLDDLLMFSISLVFSYMASNIIYALFVNRQCRVWRRIKFRD